MTRNYDRDRQDRSIYIVSKNMDRQKSAPRRKVETWPQFKIMYGEDRHMEDWQAGLAHDGARY